MQTTPTELPETTLQDDQGLGTHATTIFNQVLDDQAPVQDDCVANETPQDGNYTVESIKEWLGRNHLMAQGTFSASDQLFPVVKTTWQAMAQGKLDFFRYFSADLEFTIRWNCPKTTFGAALLVWQYGRAFAAATSSQVAQAQDVNCLKTLFTFSGSSARLLAPWFFLTSHWDLNTNSSYGTLLLRMLVPPTTVTDIIPSVPFSIYMRFLNVSLLTPVPYSLIPQGAMISRYLPETFNTVGQNTIHVYSEGLNLARIHGVDPAVMLGRDNKPALTTLPDGKYRTYNDLGAIPSYQVFMAPGTPQTVNPITAWGEVFQSCHAWTRWDTKVKLHLIGTPFHSGRLRVYYLPDGQVPVGSTLSDRDMQGFTALWDIQESATLEFNLPYTSNQEFNRFPVMLIKAENPLSSPFTAVVLPSIVAEVTIHNVRVLGLSNDYRFVTTNAVITGSTTSRSPWDTSVAGALPQPNALSSVYSPVHAADDQGVVNIQTTARRPGPYIDVGTSAIYDNPIPLIPNILGIVYNNRVTTGDRVFTSKAVAFIQRAAGWRGSMKLSIIPSNPVPGLKAGIQWTTTNPAELATAGGVLVPESGAEIVIPYTTPYNFYGCGGDQTLGPAPIINAHPGTTTETFQMYLSFLADFEILYPQSLSTSA